KGERRNQRSRADSGDDVECGPPACLGPADEHTCSKGAVASAARDGQEFAVEWIDVRIGLRGGVSLIGRYRNCLPADPRGIITPEPDLRITGKARRSDERFGYRASQLFDRRA